MQASMADRTFNMEQVAAEMTPLLGDILRLAGLDVKFEMRQTAGTFNRGFENPDMIVDFDGADADYLVANKGEVLRALEHIVLEAIDLHIDHRERILFDCRDYRMLRVEELQLAAQAAAEKVRRTGVAYKFGPMNSRERRIVHMALRGEQGVRSESEGMGLQRRVVVSSTDAAHQQKKAKGHPPSR